MAKLGIHLVGLLLAFARLASSESDTRNIANAAAARALQSLDDVETVRIGDQSATVTVTIDQTAANGLLTYGEKFVVLTPLVAGSDTEVTCTATLASSLVNMQFFMRKALRPDKDNNGNSKDYDCGAMSDNDLIEPDIESCTVTNFGAGDAVFAYVAVLDDTFAMGATYTINFVCEKFEPDGGFCFSEENTVEVFGKGKTQMKDLSVGDNILVGDNSYEPVYAFGHLDRTKSAEYLQIHTSSDNAPLQVTGDHLLLVNDQFLPAKEAKVGDSLQDAISGLYTDIIKITTKQKKGLYAPLTPSGTLVVNGVQASSYVSLQNDETAKGNVIVGGIDTALSYHFVNHIALTPIRLACMGISSSFCSVDHIDQDSGYPPFVSFWFRLTKMFQDQASPATQFLLLAFFFCIVGPLYILEVVFGSTSTPSVMVGAAGLWRVAKQRHGIRNTAPSKKEI